MLGIPHKKKQKTDLKSYLVSDGFNAVAFRFFCLWGLLFPGSWNFFFEGFSFSGFLSRAIVLTMQKVTVRLGRDHEGGREVGERGRKGEER